MDSKKAEGKIIVFTGAAAPELKESLRSVNVKEFKFSPRGLIEALRWRRGEVRAMAQALGNRAGVFGEIEINGHRLGDYDAAMLDLMVYKGARRAEYSIKAAEKELEYYRKEK